MKVNMAQQKPEQSSQQEEDYRHGRRHHHGGISGIGTGVFLLLLGILLFLTNRGILSWDKWWQFLIIGIGIILLVDTLVQYQKDSAREIRIGGLIGAIIVIAVGVAFLVSNVAWWPLVIILLGVAIIVSGLLRRGRRKS